MNLSDANHSSDKRPADRATPSLVDQIHARRARARVLSLLATPALFTSWLEQHPDEAIVGHCALPSRCPLTEFLASQGVFVPQVSGTQIDFEVDGYGLATLRLPRWASKAVRGFDALSSYSVALTAGDCLRVLARIDQEDLDAAEDGPEIEWLPGSVLETHACGSNGSWPLAEVSA